MSRKNNQDTSSNPNAVGPTRSKESDLVSQRVQSTQNNGDVPSNLHVWGPTTEPREKFPGVPQLPQPQQSPFFVPQLKPQSMSSYTTQHLSAQDFAKKNSSSGSGPRMS